MARLRPRIGPLGVALTMYDVWRRLPPRQRKLVLQLARKHGPKVAARVLEMRRATKKRR
jgi:TRAP-type C4-dicarboxylate transport system substrate-binding protein